MECVAHVGRLKLYLTCYYEATLCNLLEVTLFHVEACEHINDEALVELIDYCCRKLVYLNTRAAEDAEFKERSPKDLLEMTDEEEQTEKLAEVRQAGNQLIYCMWTRRQTMDFHPFVSVVLL